MLCSEIDEQTSIGFGYRLRVEHHRQRADFEIAQQQNGRTDGLQLYGLNPLSRQAAHQPLMRFGSFTDQDDILDHFPFSVESSDGAKSLLTRFNNGSSVQQGVAETKSNSSSV